MFKIQGIALCAVLALIAGQAQAARVGKVEGSIAAINAVGTPPTVTIGDVTVKVVSATKIIVGDERGSLLDLTVGAEANAHYDVGSGIARKIQVEQTEEDATALGVILSADPISGAITLDTTGDSVLDLTLATSAQTQIKVGGVILTQAELAALEGLRVKVEYLTATFEATNIEAGDHVLLSARGTVSAVDPLTGTITIQTASGPLTVELAEGAVIRIGGQAVELSEVLVGDTVQVLYLVGDVNLALRLTVQPLRTQHVTGVITSVDDAMGTITVARGASTVVLTLGANTDLRINGRSATLAQIQTALDGDRTVKVSASFIARAEVNLANKVQVNIQGRGRR